MQKDEYRQEKELLRRKGELMRMEHSSRRTKTLIKDENTSELVLDGLHDVPDESKIEKNEHEDLNLAQTSNRTSARRRPSSASVTTPSSIPTTDRKNDQFVRNMEERARMREQLKREREEKKKKQEQEKLELMKGKYSDGNEPLYFLSILN